MSSVRFNRNQVLEILSELSDPETGRDLVQMDQVRQVEVSGEEVWVTLGLTTWAMPIWDSFRQECEELLSARLPGVKKVTVDVIEHERPAEKIGQIGLTVKSVIAVGSGKGGVGKSTIAASIAYGLRNAGCKVGLMDADVYGPSIPHLLGIGDVHPEAVNRRLQPIEKDGLCVMSMGFIVPPGEAVVWRGPMLHGAITQFLRDTDWGDLDYLIIDMPPGTGDIALTLSQLLPLTGAVVVCTPQDVALLDASKAIAMFRKVNIAILGIVENMSYFVCPDSGKRYDIFGSGGARRKATEVEVPFLGEVPIQIPIRERGDAGVTSENFSDEASAWFLGAICKNLVKNLAQQHTEAPVMPSLPVL